MPRAHTEHERQAIRERLLTTAREQFVRLGLHKTTVSDLARGAGIGKGSFYQFFESKEQLFLAVNDEEESQFKATLVQEIEAAGSGREAILALLQCVTTRIERHPFLRMLLDPQLLQSLTLRVSPQLLEQHRDQDRAFFLALAQDWKQRGWLRDEVRPETVFDVLVAMFGMSVQRDLLGTESVERAVVEIAAAVADRWCND